MTEIVWTNQAQADLGEIYDYIATKDPQAALKLIEDIEQRVEQLKIFPESGRKVPELTKAPHTYRELIIKNYRVIYRYSGEKVYVLHVRHAKQRLKGAS